MLLPACFLAVFVAVGNILTRTSQQRLALALTVGTLGLGAHHLALSRSEEGNNDCIEVIERG